MNELKDFDINEFKIGQNLYIEASAGTGKTYTIELLVEKMLKNDIPLSKILIVTYTEKAAGELCDRIRKKIISCLEKEPNNLILAKALQELGNAQIFTFHSFCQNVLNNFAFETKSSLNLELVNDNDVNNLVDKFIRDRWQNNSDFQELLEKADLNYKNLKTELTNAVNKYNLFTVTDIQNITVDKNDKSKPDKLEKYYKDLEKKFVLEHFRELITEWQKYKKDNNLISFSDMINLVHEKVCDESDTSLVDRLKEAYRYAIIDEFQDTNSKQWDIFKKIFLEKVENRLPRSLTTARNDVFTNNIVVVGDPKQSIFSFQGAEIEVYKKAVKEIGRNGIGRKLSVNYRSSEAMINACNVLFTYQEKEIEISQGSGKPKKKEKVLENIFGGIKESNNGIEFNDSHFPVNSIDANNKKAILNGKEVEPIWLSDPSSEYEYAKYAVSKIVECIKADENGNTDLQIYDKFINKMRSVKFSDFAVLARTRSEMPYIEDEMTKVGIPFYRYKDATLFDGKECKEWISLLMLLDVPDFASYNRKILNQALLTDFFRINLENVESEEYVNPTKEPMSFILEWRRLAEKRLWAALKEKIFEDSQIEVYLSNKSKSSSLVKIRQIANYIFDYLFNHKVSIEEMIKHLNGLASKTEETDSEGELVENTNDLDAVRIMTIYASKGLEFPVVIMVGSLRGVNNFISGPFVYFNDQTKILGFENSVKNQETYMEWRRLIYVAYTRARYILLLPDFSQKIRGPWSGKTNFSFLTARMKEIKKSSFVRKYECSYNLEDFQSIVKEYIEKTQKEKKIGSTIEKAKEQIASLQKSLPSLRTYQLSYSSISSNLKEKFETASNNIEYDSSEFIMSDDNRRLDKEDSADDDLIENDSIILKKFKNIDNPENIIKACQNYIPANDEMNEIDNYPKGARLGNAIHEIFELIRFENFGRLKDNKIYNVPELNNLIIERFEKQSLPIKANDNWVEKSIRIVWNTLNADLPVIQGNKVVEGKTFKLKSLSDDARKAEVEFLFDIITSESNYAKSLSQESSLLASERGVAIQCNDNYKKLNKLCKGFIDLLFVRKENGIDYYSILDWKSDYMDKESYSNGEALAEKVAEEYTVQRVLYSYLLIKWLKQFYCDLSEEEIFEQHFGGIYYAFVRGCKADCSNGIYAQTWKSYSALEESYTRLITELGIRS